MFVDRLLAALVRLRNAVTHDVLACWFGVNRSTITRGHRRSAAAARRARVHHQPGCMAAAPTEVVDHLGAGGKTGIVDGTEIRVRRPTAGRKMKENAPDWYEEIHEWQRKATPRDLSASGMALRM
ncbi:transposase family protein [Streptomyces andamanensis]|uniref:Transposase family protein n=1 Tax=Streptomyces andamanensis TaxID=1565035 RepID=A0ABV8TLK9_9ACTN